MKLGLIAQIRDEIDIIETWLQHVDALFDYVFLVDHQSIDGTGEILKKAVAQRQDWKYFYLDVKTYIQAATSTFVLHEAFTFDLDYLFFLDADEFIDVKDRNELENLLHNRPEITSLADLHWKNCIQHEFDKDFLNFSDLIWIPEQISNHKKIIIPREVYEKYGKDLTIAHGNHSASATSVGPLNTYGIGTLLHVPIRSREQAIKKVILMVIAMQGFKNCPSGRATHIFEILQRIGNNRLTDDEVRGFTITYDKILEDKFSVTEAELIEQNYRLISLNELHIARKESLVLNPVRNEAIFARQLANALTKPEENIPEFIKLKLNNNVIQVDKSDLNPSLPAKVKKNMLSLIRKLRKKLHL